jgi:hypothetical protein
MERYSAAVAICSKAALPSESPLDDGAPEDEHVHARIAALSRGVYRQSERRPRRRRSPGLHPGHTAGFQLDDDLVGNLLIEARPVQAGASGRVRHRSSPRRAPRASLAALNPSRDNRLSLTLVAIGNPLPRPPHLPGAHRDFPTFRIRLSRGTSAGSSDWHGTPNVTGARRVGADVLSFAIMHGGPARCTGEARLNSRPCV